MRASLFGDLSYLPSRHVCHSVNRRRLLNTAILVAGLVALAVAAARTLDDTRDQVLPSAGALAVAGGLALVAILASGRAWVTLFHDVLDNRGSRARFEAGYYLSQLTKYEIGRAHV